MKRLLLATVTALALPLCAMAQSNDTTANGAVSPGTTGSGMSATTNGGIANDASPSGMSTTGGMSGSASVAKLSLQDTHFINTAAISGLSEVSDGQLATTKGNTNVKKIGAVMVADHTTVNSQLMALAKQKGVTPPMSVDIKHAAIHHHLETLSGSSFDAKYLSTEVLGHEMTIAAFKTEASTGSDPQLKAFASATLPQLQEHLAMIKAAFRQPSSS